MFLKNPTGVRGWEENVTWLIIHSLQHTNSANQDLRDTTAAWITVEILSNYRNPDQKKESDIKLQPSSRQTEGWSSQKVWETIALTLHRDLCAESPYLYMHPVDSVAAPQLISDTYTEGLTAGMPKNTQQTFVAMQTAYKYVYDYIIGYNAIALRNYGVIKVRMM